MKLLTKELITKLRKAPLYSRDGKRPEEVPIIVKFFNPAGIGTWYVTEGSETDNGDWEFFGYVDLGGQFGGELGYFQLSQLTGIRLPFGLSIERDMHFGAHTLAEVYCNGERP
jgi:hypothetical protein